MHGPCQEPLRNRACTALSLLILSWAAMTPSQAASVESRATDVVEPPLFELVVTARKRPQVLEDVPASIYAVTAPMIAATATRDLVDLAGQVSGMVFSLAPDDGLALTVRGVGTPARPQALDQSIALFLDGTYLAKGPLYPLALFDIERVEVVRGPHSTEVGKNASVGALSVVSREPGATNALDGAGSWDAERGGYALEAGADLQLGADSALRLAGAHFDRHGWVRNDATGNDVPEDQDSGVRLTLRTRPRNGCPVSCAFKSTIVSDSAPRRSSSAHPDPCRPGPAIPRSMITRSRSRRAAPEGDSHHETRAHIASAHFDFSTGDHSWVSETAWVDFDGSTLDDIDFNASANVDFLRDQKFHQISQELRVASPAGGTLEYLAGVFYLDSSWHSVETEYWNTPGFPPGTPIAGQLFNGPYTNDFSQDTRSMAVFANGTWRATDRMQRVCGFAPDGRAQGRHLWPIQQRAAHTLEH